MQVPAIVRNRLKIESAIGNAKAVLKLQDEVGSLSKHLWSFVGGKPIVNKWTSMKQVPATSAESDALSKDLKKRGFKFVGSTIIYAHMQATGMVNDHTVGCFRHQECAKLASELAERSAPGTCRGTREYAARGSDQSRFWVFPHDSAVRDWHDAPAIDGGVLR